MTAAHKPLALVLVATVLAFGASVAFPFVRWDDPRYVTENPLLAHPLGQGLRELLQTPVLGYPQPVTVLSFALNRALFGMAPWSFHLANLLVHLANVALVATLASSLGLSQRLSAAAAMVFGLHPLVVEPVCWVTGRKDLLATGFVLLGTLILLGRNREREDATPGVGRWVVATVVCLLGVGAKPSVFIAPALIFIVCRVARPSWPARQVVPALTPLAVLGAAVAFSGRPVGVDLHPRSLVAAALDILGAWTLQLGHLVWPVDLVTKYYRVDGDPPVAAMVVGAMAIVATVVALVRLDKRSPIFAGLAFAVVAYAPVSTIIAANRWTADSYMYLPLVGVSVALVVSARALVSERWERVATLACFALGVVLAVDAFAIEVNWRTPEGIWLAAIDRYPTNPYLNAELARTLYAEGKIHEAVGAFLKIDESFPDDPVALDERAAARRASGDDARSEFLLARGISIQDVACARSFWKLLLAGKIARAPQKLPAIAASFDLVAANDGLRESSDWARAGGLLHALGLESQAAQADAKAAAR